MTATRLRPIITLKGPRLIRLPQYGQFVDPGHESSDGSPVIVSYELKEGNRYTEVEGIDTTFVGAEFVVKYNATNPTNDKAAVEKKREVVIISADKWGGGFENGSGEDLRTEVGEEDSRTEVGRRTRRCPRSIRHIRSSNWLWT